MRSLYESLFDIDDNVDNVPDSFVIGDEYEIAQVYCRSSVHIFKKSFLKVKPPKNFHKSPKITDFDDSTNKLMEVLCNIILNLPAECISDVHESCMELSSYLDSHMKAGMSNPYIMKNGGTQGYVFHVYGRKWVTCRDKDGTPRRDQPGVTIFLKRK